MKSLITRFFSKLIFISVGILFISIFYFIHKFLNQPLGVIEIIIFSIALCTGGNKRSVPDDLLEFLEMDQASFYSEMSIRFTQGCVIGLLYFFIIK